MGRTFLRPAPRLACERRPDLWKYAGREPAIAAMLEDPIVRLVMQRDGLTADDVREVVARARVARRRRCGRERACLQLVEL